MALHLVTGYQGQAHITSADQGVFNAGCVGTGEYVFATGRRLEAQVVTSNAVRIYDGSLLMQGRHVNMEYGTFLDVIISNGLQSMNRHDLIVLRYRKDVSTGIESVELAVVQGALSEGTAVDPSYTKGNILAGDTLHEMPLYRVVMSGLNIARIEPMFKVVTPLGDAQNGRNLLINGDFLCNQRGNTTYTADSNTTPTVKYSLDMWRIHNIKLTVLTDGGINVVGRSSTATGYLTQFVKVRNLAEKYTISAMIDNKVCTFTTALTSTAAEKEYDKFKISALYLADSKQIKVNICPIKTNSIKIVYIDLFEGDIAYPHVVEDTVVAMARCKQYIQNINTICPITYSYPSSDGSKKSYVTELAYSGMISIANVESCTVQYQSTDGHVIPSTKSNFKNLTKGANIISIRTADGAVKHSDCYATEVSCVLSCEYAPDGD